MTLHDFFRALLKNWIVIVALVLVGGVGAYAYATTLPEKYRSSSSVMVTTGLGSTAQELVQGSTYIEKLVASYALLARSEIVLEPVINELDLDTTVAKLAGSVSATSTLNTVIIDISAVAGDPTSAQQLTASVTRNLAKAVADVSPHDGSGQSSVTLTTIESASMPNARFEPNTRVWGAVGAFLGLAAGVLFALLRRYFADVITSPGDLALISDLPIVGEIPESRRGRSIATTIIEHPLSVEAEAFGALSANLNFVRVDGSLRSLVVTSGSPGEGKSTAALSLALILAAPSKKVLLIDADMRSPSLAAMTGLDGSVGLTSVLVKDVNFDDAIQSWGTDGLFVLASGPSAPNPAQLLRSDALKSLIVQATTEFDMVVIDSAPMLSVTDAVWLGHSTDGVLVVARRGKTKVRSFGRTLLALADAKVPVIGVVLSRMPRRTRAAYGDAYLASTR